MKEAVDQILFVQVYDICIEITIFAVRFLKTEKFIV